MTEIMAFLCPNFIFIYIDAIAVTIQKLSLALIKWRC